MKTKIGLKAIIAIFILSIPMASYCKDDNIKDIIDIKEEECINNNQTTDGMNYCTAKAMESWDKELNIAYNRLMDKLDNKSKESLIKSQKAWIKSRNEEFKFMDIFYNKVGGTMYTNVRSGNKTEFVKHRVLTLRSYLYEISN